MAIKIFKSSESKEVIVHSIISLFVRVLSVLSAFLMNLTVARVLGVEGAGYFLLALSIITFLSTVGRCGFDNLVLRFSGISSGQNTTLISSQILKKTLLGCFVISVALALILAIFSKTISVSFFSKPELDLTLLSISPGLVGVSLFTLLAMALQGLRRIILSVFILNISVNIIFILIALSGVMHSSTDASLAFSASALITAILGGLIYLSIQRKSKEANLTVVLEQTDIGWGTVLTSAIPLWTVIVLSQFVQWSGQFLSGGYVPADDIARFAVAQRTSMLTSFALMAVNLVVAPRFAAFYHSGKLVELRRLAIMSTRLVVVGAAPMVIAVFFFPDLIMSFFGKDFIEGASLLKILTIGQLVSVLTGSAGYLLMMSGHEKDVQKVFLFSAPLIFILIMTLTPIWGIVGTAWATSITISVQSLITVFFVKRRLGFYSLEFK
ncbi:TPA: oligosaccharide flippase family protein [Serratia marcescens]|jgi:O-antigen/teichoic acid export membrane protein|uniref:oligosaccharide flippase family protein n=1 Tax=Serratia TaxID=613 RepID=UPI0011520C3E|nr:MULTISPECIES: oligosaccharide flippase family protein [Serratia]EIV2912818.1 oligosaccharide flippase family protein [Serratia marcescens]MBH2749103.1 oligosaccharide flippase family protein [Serratia marcescens]MBH2770190.1 oligosaccharide flippase family protein [Serratia marcescens]MBH2969774.1 oligosaccharide flippase family protein [Serratia marcescens]MBH3260439.1 oligosaccharide flippase family protein [Serratia marcescens]